MQQIVEIEAADRHPICLLAGISEVAIFILFLCFSLHISKEI